MINKKDYDPRLDPDDEDQPYNQPNTAEHIILERREIIGEIVSTPGGTERMVVAAFHKAGEYLDGIASQSDDFQTVQFEYRGKKFFAGYGDI